MKYGARNQIIGKVIDIKRGGVMGQVKLEIPAKSRMGSVMTLDSIDELKLKRGPGEGHRQGHPRPSGQGKIVERSSFISGTLHADRPDARKRPSAFAF